MNTPIILSTERSRYFAQLITEGLNGETSEFYLTQGIERSTFANGEKYLRIAIRKRTDLLGKTIIMVGSPHFDEEYLEIWRLGCALPHYGAKRVIYIMPYLGYSTMERSVKPGEVVTAKTNIRLLSHIPHGDDRNAFFLMDLHKSGLLHYFEGDCLRFELYAEDALTKAIQKLELENYIFGSADLGCPKWIRTYARKFDTRMVLIDKGREGEKTEVLDIIGDVKGKIVIIYDDMTRSADSIINAAKTYLDHGAVAVYVVLSHLALNTLEVAERILSSGLIEKVISTNTHFMSQSDIVKSDPRFEIVDVSPLFVDAIQDVLNG